jgi:hypothetical protein
MYVSEFIFAEPLLRCANGGPTIRFSFIMQFFFDRCGMVRASTLYDEARLHAHTGTPSLTSGSGGRSDRARRGVRAELAL